MKRDYEAEIVWALRNAPMRFDAGETSFITRELLAIKPKLYETEYPQLQATEFIPIASDVDPGAEAIAYQMTDSYGKAKIIANDAKDLPRVSSLIQETQTPVRTIGAEYVYTWLDMRRSALQRVPLPTRLANRARKTIAEGVDYSLAFGDAQTGLVGFTNAPNVTITAAAAAWSGATALQMYADLTAAAIRVQNNTKGIHRATDIILPVAAYAQAQVTPWSATGASDMTVLKFFMANNPGIRISPWYLLNTAGAGSVTRAIVYDRNADVVEGQVPMPFYEFAPQADRLALIVPCIARVGGVQVRFPKGMEYIDGL